MNHKEHIPPLRVLRKVQKTPNYFLARRCLLTLCLFAYFFGFVHAQEPFSKDYYSYLDNYFSDTTRANDEAEGGETKHMIRQARMWAPRLYPEGNYQKAGTGMLGYVQQFLKNGKGTQKNTGSSLADPNWRSIGPIGQNTYRGTNGIGRIHRIAFHPDYNGKLPIFPNSNRTLFAVSSFGGLWKSTDDGMNWSVFHTDTQLPFTNVSDAALNPHGTLYISTGLADERGGAGHNIAGTNNINLNFFGPNNGGDNALLCHGVYRWNTSNSTWENISTASVNPVFVDLLSTFQNGGTIRKMMIHPQDSNKIYLATSKGIIRSPNATAPANQVLWQIVQEDHSSPGANREWRGLAFKPNSASTLYASGKDIWRSTSDGDPTSWHSMTGSGTGLDLQNMPHIVNPANFQVMRINIATTPANDSLLYAYIIGLEEINANTPEHNRVLYIYSYKEDSGWTYHHHRRDRGRPLTPLEDRISPRRIPIAASPQNAYEVYYGDTRIMGTPDIRSIPFTRRSEYNGDNIHADIHELKFAPDWKGPIAPLFAGTDGGVSTRKISNTQSDDWDARSQGLEVATIWTFDDSERDPSLTLSGLQDVAVFRTSQGNLPGTYVWDPVRGGDGYGARIDDTRGIMGYWLANDVFGRVNLQTGGVNVEGLRPTDRPDGQGNDARIPYTFPMQNHPQTDHMYFGFSEIYKRLADVPPNTTDWTDTWEHISNLRATISNWGNGNEWKRTLTEMEIAPSNPDYIYISRPGSENAGIDDAGGGDFRTNRINNRLMLIRPSQYDPNAAGGVVLLHHNLKSALGLWGVPGGDPTQSPIQYIPVITDIAIDPKDHNRLWVSFSGYDATAKVWFTEDGGTSWQNADPNGDLANLPVNAIEYVNGSDDCLLIGTDAGVYVKENTTSNWVEFGEDFPHVRVMELKVNYCAGRIRVATYGRGLWEGDLDIPNYLDTERLITGDVTWNEDRNLTGNLRIASGSVLTLTAELNMPENGRIRIERGGKMIVDGGVITNRCGKNWHGIEVFGNAHLAHPSLADVTHSQPTNHPHHGVLYVKNRSLIEHARNAVSLIERTPTYEVLSNAGGIIIAENSRFSNNKRSIEFMKFRPSLSGGGSDDNVSQIIECTFEHTRETRFPHSQIVAMISAWNVAGVKIRANTFINQDPNEFDPSHRGTGIYTIDAGYSVDGLCLASSQSGCIKYKGNVFQDLNRGIFASESSTIAGAVVIENNKFIDCITGSELIGIQNNVQYTQNQHWTPSGYAGSPIGTLVQGCSGFIISDNAYFGGGNTDDWGILIENSGNAEEELYKNHFESLNNGIDAIGNNSGLQIKCNYFDNIGIFNIRNLDVSLPDQGSCGQITAPANNRINDGFCPAGSDIQIHVDPSLAGFKYFAPSSPDYIPDCYSSNVDLHFCNDPFSSERSCPNKLEIFEELAPDRGRIARLDNLIQEAKTKGLNTTNLTQQRTQSIKEIHHHFQLQQKFSEAIEFLRTDGSVYSKKILIPLLIQTDELEEAVAILKAYPQETLEQQSFVSLQSWLIQQKQDGRDYRSMTDQEARTLRKLAKTETSAGVNALAILHFVFGEEIPRKKRESMPSHSPQLHAELEDVLNPLDLHPNPAKDQLVLSYELPKGFSEGTLVLMTTEGKQIKEVSISQASGQEVWDLSQYPSGVYIIQMRSDDTRVSQKKLVIQK